jgi:hypothetical protein
MTIHDFFSPADPLPLMPRLPSDSLATVGYSLDLSKNNSQPNLAKMRGCLVRGYCS